VNIPSENMSNYLYNREIMKNEQEKKIKDLLFRELDPAFARRAGIIASNVVSKGNETILEVGCGRGFYEQFIPYLHPLVRMIAIDRNDAYLDRAKIVNTNKNVRFHIDDAMNLSFNKSSFDSLISTEVLEHLPDDERALREFHRVLKKNGVAVLTVPCANYPFFWDPLNWVLERVFHTHISKDIWFLAGIWADHVRLYTEEDFVQKCKKAGFKVEKVWRSTHYCLPFIHFLLYGIGKNIVERGFLPSFYRFSTEKKEPGKLFSFVRSIIYWFDAYNKESEETGVSTLNYIVKLRKI